MLVTLINDSLKYLTYATSVPQLALAKSWYWTKRSKGVPEAEKGENARFFSHLMLLNLAGLAVFGLPTFPIAAVVLGTELLLSKSVPTWIKSYFNAYTSELYSLPFQAVNHPFSLIRFAKEFHAELKNRNPQESSIVSAFNTVSMYYQLNQFLKHSDDAKTSEIAGKRIAELPDTLRRKMLDFKMLRFNSEITRFDLKPMPENVFQSNLELQSFNTIKAAVLIDTRSGADAWLEHIPEGKEAVDGARQIATDAINNATKDAEIAKGFADLKRLTTSDTAITTLVTTEPFVRKVIEHKNDFFLYQWYAFLKTLPRDDAIKQASAQLEHAKAHGNKTAIAMIINQINPPKENPPGDLAGTYDQPGTDSPSSKDADAAQLELRSTPPSCTPQMEQKREQLERQQAPDAELSQKKPDVGSPSRLPSP